MLPSFLGNEDLPLTEDEGTTPTAVAENLVKDRSVLTTNGKDRIDGAPEDNTRLCDISAWIRTTRALY